MLIINQMNPYWRGNCQDCGAICDVRSKRCRRCSYEYQKSTFVQRFWSKVSKTTDCWIWKGPFSTGNYGKFNIGQRQIKAHRLSYELANGSIPAGLMICHKCDNPPCVRPDHLFAGTLDDNNKDMAKKGRAHRPIGELGPIHKLTEQQVRKIRAYYLIHHERGTIASLAREYNVTGSTMEYVVKGKTWSHVK